MGRFSDIRDRLSRKTNKPGVSLEKSSAYSSSPVPAAPNAASPVKHPASTSQLAKTLPITTVTSHAAPEPVASAGPQPPKSLPSSDIDLWALAYEILSEREPKLIADYKHHLDSLHSDAAARTDLFDPQSVKAIVGRLLEDREKKQWRVSLPGRDVKIRDQVERLSKLLLWADPLVKDAVSAQPYAALAWSGVSLLLPVGA